MLQQASLTTWDGGLFQDDDVAFLRAASRQLAHQYGLDPARVEVGYRRYTTLKSTARQSPKWSLKGLMWERAEPRDLTLRTL